MILCRRTKLLLFFILTFVVVSCNNQGVSTILKNLSPRTSPEKTAAPAAPKLAPSYVAAKKAKIETFCKKYWSSKNSSVSLLVAKDDQIIYEKYVGYSNNRKKLPITYETPMHIASVSKVITATAILQLVDNGKIYLNQKVKTILPNFPYPEITVKMLLNHRSGMRNYAYFTSEKGVWNTRKVLTNRDIVTLMATKKIKLETKPNTHFSYCNTNYAVLALIIEKITGMSYKDAMRKMIFVPFKMTHSFVFDYDTDRDSVALSYRRNNSLIPYDYLDAIYGDKNIFSTPRDLLKFDIARKSDNFLTPDLKAQIFQGYSNEHKGTKNYGLGIRMINWKDGKNFYFHNGWWHGNMSSYVILPDENVTMIAVTNKSAKQVYRTRDLATLFGKYPFKVADDLDFEE